jgi:hypothetical protein
MTDQSQRNTFVYYSVPIFYLSRSALAIEKI